MRLPRPLPNRFRICRRLSPSRSRSLRQLCLRSPRRQLNQTFRHPLRRLHCSPRKRARQRWPSRQPHRSQNRKSPRFQLIACPLGRSSCFRHHRRQHCLRAPLLLRPETRSPRRLARCLSTVSFGIKPFSLRSLRHCLRNSGSLCHKFGFALMRSGSRLWRKHTSGFTFL